MEPRITRHTRSCDSHVTGYLNTGYTGYNRMINTWSFSLLLCFLQCLVFAGPSYVIQEWSSGKLSLACSQKCGRADVTCQWRLNQTILSDGDILTIDSGSEYGEYMCYRTSDNVVLRKVLLIPPGELQIS